MVKEELCNNPVQIQQTYVEPDVTCVDKIYEDGNFVRNDYYDAVTDAVIDTDIEPEDLPKVIFAGYTCLDGAKHVAHGNLYVVLVEDLDVINTPPTIKSIVRKSPLTQNTDSQTLVFAVYFDKAVNGVDKDDFILSPSSTGGTGNGTSPVTGVSGSGSVRYVTVSAPTDGMYTAKEKFENKTQNFVTD